MMYIWTLKFTMKKKRKLLIEPLFLGWFSLPSTKEVDLIVVICMYVLT